jgi:alpha-mannosidase
MTHPHELILVPHTHWDREWYQTFQQFRMRLVRAVDKVLDVLDRDPAFAHFMLDGQTIVLEDYLEVRPENAGRLHAYAQSGRLLIGPWYLQPDEFLVGGESLIRNLLMGAQIGAAYGGVMNVGYVPDTFGHIAQLPQILQGFGIDNAIFWRGVGKEVRQSEFWWAAPDGTRVLVLHLADPTGYSNARILPLNVTDFLTRLKVMEDALLPKSSTGILLLMNGSDHLEPQDGLPAVIAEANARLSDAHITIGTLPQYVEAIKRAEPALETFSGEWRSSQVAHLLPGVLSTRIWIKQRNTAGEHLLTDVAEPLCAWAWALGESYPAGFLRVAWRHLLHNHPHDSICGCSIDQVHREMVSRFDQSQQIAEGLIEEKLAQLASRVNTAALPGDGAASAPLVVFNPAAGPRSDVVTCTVEALPGVSDLAITDAGGHVMPLEVVDRASKELGAIDLTADVATSMLSMASSGEAMGFSVLRVDFKPGREEGVTDVEITVATHGKPNPAAIQNAIAEGTAIAARPGFKYFHITLREALHETVRFVARDVPAHGYKTFLARARQPEDGAQEAPELATSDTSIENAFYRVSVDPATGTLTVLDKTTGAAFAGLNRFEDGGDVGDLYNYCPPLAEDTLVNAPACPPEVALLERGPVRATLRVALDYLLPAHCSVDRAQRSAESVHCAIVTDVSLTPGVRRIDCSTRVENQAKDHRLRVLFPVPFAAAEAEAEGTFEVRRRPAQARPPDGDPANWESWAERPVNTQPQKRFVSVSDGSLGLAVLNKGLPEYEIIPARDGHSASVALTLLRCIGWLSRGDLSTRRGHAGPMEFTPDAQLQGTWSFEYALVPHAGGWRADEAEVQRQAQALQAPLRAIMAKSHAGPLPLTASLVDLAPGALVVSAIKRAEREEALLTRFYNPLEREQEATLTLGLAFREALLARLDEEPLGAEQQARLERLSEQSLRLRLRTGEIVTVLFRL